MKSLPGKVKGDVWFVYDGDCPICTTAAAALRIREAVGNLHLVNAREESSHPLMGKIKEKGLNLDEGMVIKFQDNYYHGADALHIMALLGTGQGWFNRMNAWLFRSKTLSAICYPPMRAARNFALRLKGIPQLRNLEQR
jgi:predicted DCC family thiol-disulfide oxidoreductase YuxK